MLQACGKDDKIGWAFGQGLERLAMIMYNIPDIRLFWSEDTRFTSQFDSSHVGLNIHQLPKFEPYSKYPVCYKDVSFWVTNDFHPNDFYELVRGVASELVESVECVSEFTHPKTGRVSHHYRINYRSMDRSLTNEEVDVLQFNVRDESVKKLGVELR